MEFLQSPTGLLAGMVLAVVGSLTLLYVLIKKFVPWFRKEQGYWKETEIEAILLPILDKVIVAVFNISEHSLETTARVLESADKQELARLSYPLILELVAKTPLPVSVFTKFVTEERWCQEVKERYDYLISWYRLSGEKLLEALRPESEKMDDGFFRIRLPDVTGVHPS